MWPVDCKQEIHRRFHLISKIKTSPRAQALAKLAYADDPVQWVRDFCITYDPRAGDPKLMPFVPFPRQEEYVQFLWYCYKNKRNGLVEKARDMGATWLSCAFSVWLWLFHPNSAIGWGSRKESLIDRLGDPSSIFEKMRMILDNLPDFMLPPGFTAKEDTPFMRLINPENGSVIIGEGGDNMGRGGRTGIYFKDESAHYERAEFIEAALGDNTDVQIDISSVNGSNNVFYRKRAAGVEWTPGCEIPANRTAVFIMDWRAHPNKDQKWYEARREKADHEGLLTIFSQEVDRDYAGSVDRLIINPLWVNAAVDAHIKLKFEANGLKFAGQDVADEGGDKNALAIRHGSVLLYVEDWGEGDTGETAQRGISKCREMGVSEYYYDAIGVGSGVKGETNRMQREGQIPKGLRVFPWFGSGEVLEPEENLISGDDQSPKNEDFFANLKAQAWWMLSIRFHKTFKAVTHGAQYDPSELISLDSNMEKLDQLKRELSQVQRKTNMNGKLIVDKKPDGARSPNLADSVVMCYCPTREVSILDVL